MPRYFFTVSDGIELEDPDGSEHPNLASAEHEARLMARDLLADGARAGLSRVRWSIRIVDANGEIQAVVPFDDVVRPDHVKDVPSEDRADKSQSSCGDSGSIA